MNAELLGPSFCGSRNVTTNIAVKPMAATGAVLSGTKDFSPYSVQHCKVLEASNPGCPQCGHGWCRHPGLAKSEGADPLSHLRLLRRTTYDHVN